MYNLIKPNDTYTLVKYMDTELHEVRYKICDMTDVHNVFSLIDTASSSEILDLIFELDINHGVKLVTRNKLITSTT
jgi:hypothetical protein